MKLKAVVASAATFSLLLEPGAQAAQQQSSDPYADSVLSFTPGTNGGFQSAQLPGIVTGPPKGSGAFQGSVDVVSLGVGGSIDLAFQDNVAVNGPGVDFTVFENAFLGHQGSEIAPPFAEPATVSVSADGVHFYAFPCALIQGPFYKGCAGVYPVFANSTVAGSPSATQPTTEPIENLVGQASSGLVQPPGSGGDSFDLAAVGLKRAKFVRLTAGAVVNWGGQSAGFDLDAVAAVNSKPDCFRILKKIQSQISKPGYASISGCIKRVADFSRFVRP